ncbi:hypothetical protein Y1Q_0022491 [Alligator mississippiensis]|uniref:Uncharacterized protein n=1 Tax=Alligator mississippiensis TaxID=8496 RepID=A0A151N0J7_ALLMI|nr:hypothetical protein Y1Q_0022491 [Alligator mississippiensis]
MQVRSLALRHKYQQIHTRFHQLNWPPSKQTPRGICDSGNRKHERYHSAGQTLRDCLPYDIRSKEWMIHAYLLAHPSS